MSDRLTYWCEGRDCVNPRWEEAYARFETEAEERSKFLARFKRLGLSDSPRDARVVNLFCGRGRELDVLAELGFQNLVGVDLSPRLLADASSAVERVVGDCRDLQFPDGSVDAFVVQGGFHHLPSLPADLAVCLRSISRCLRPGGKLYVVEPWDTPFLRFVHLASRARPVRWLAPKMDALATMIEEEADTYFRWLSEPAMIADLFSQQFRISWEIRSRGKWMAVCERA